MDFHLPETPYTVTVRRNPHRKARQTRSTIKAPDPSKSNPPCPINDIPPFPVIDLDSPSPLKSPQKTHESENLQVFLRIRPVAISPVAKKVPPARGQVASRSKAFPEKEKKKKTTLSKSDVCLTVNDTRSVTITTPSLMVETKRTKTETYDGFTYVFPSDSRQKEVYDRVMDPLVADFIGGKSRLLAAMGPTGSGKTHTVFGSPREPGMVPLALRRIFDSCSGNGASQLPRSYYLSMFEIYSERGKGERLLDLSPDGGDLCLQQATVKGLKEIMVSELTQAECLIARGMLKRATAATNANSQSSRSQCIINIRSASKMVDEEDEFLEDNAILTIVDLAGAERERRTGNQGARLIESNFINNTSMVFGLCLRSLLEHQQNNKKPLQKHFQNSLLTRYLRDYLEGKKRMTLILTVKPGEDDYLDTSFWLRQASPYVNIKFNNVEELSTMPCQKRHIPFVRIEQRKRRKCAVDAGKSARDDDLIPEKEVLSEQLQKLESLQVSASSLPISEEVGKHASHESEYRDESQRKDRNDQVMRDFSKAIWNVLKQYKRKLQVAENEVHSLKESLAKEKIQVVELEEELSRLKSSCSVHYQPSSVVLEENLTPKENDDSFGVDGCCPNQKASEGNTNVKIFYNSSMENQRVSSLVMETFDTIVTDSRLSTKEDTKRQSYLNVDSCLETAHDAGYLRGPEHLEVDISSTTDLAETGLRTPVPVASSSQSLPWAGDSNCELIPSVEQNTFATEDENVGEANSLDVRTSPNPNGSEWHSDVKGPETFVEHNWKFSVQMENYDTVVLDSRLSIEDFRTESNQNRDSFTMTKYDTKDLEDVEPLEASNISSVTDMTGSTPAVQQGTSSQAHVLFKDSSFALISSMEQNTLTKEQDHCRLPVATHEVSTLQNQSSAPNLENQVSASCASPDKDIASIERNPKAVPKREKEVDLMKPLNVEKPRRRLLPAASILVKEFGGIDVEDENLKRRGEQKPNAEEKGRTKGSVSLVRLLRKNLYL